MQVKEQTSLMTHNFMILFRRFDYRYLIAPLGVMIILWYLIAAGLYSYGRQELESLAILVNCFLLMALVVRLCISRHVFFLWSTGLMGLVLAREIHFDWTDAGIYIGLIVMLGVASLKYDALKDYLDTPWVINLVAIGLFTYVLSQTIDQRWWKGLPEEDFVHVPLEETMEVLGHCFIGAALLGARKLSQKMATPGSQRKPNIP